MSTVDPAQRRAQKQQQAKGGPGALVMTALAAVACVATGYLFGRGFTGIFGVFREMAFEGINSQSSSVGPPWMWALPVGIITGLAALAWYASASAKYTGGRGLPVPGLVWAGAGATYGILMQTRQWAGPVRVGYTTIWGPASPWGPWAWIMYRADIWLPIVAVAITAVVLIMGVMRTVRRSARSRQAERLVNAGRRAPGEVSQAAWTGVEIGGLKQVSFTVHFADDQGVDRWVTKKSTFDPTALPFVGMPATVLYDPLDMDEKKIAVVLEPLESVEQKVAQGLSAPVAVEVPATGGPRTWAAPDASPAPAGHPAWGQVTDVVTVPTATGTTATFTLRVSDAGAPAFTATVQATFAAGSARAEQWCRIGAQVPIVVQPGATPTVQLDPTRTQ